MQEKRKSVGMVSNSKFGFREKTRKTEKFTRNRFFCTAAVLSHSVRDLRKSSKTDFWVEKSLQSFSSSLLDFLSLLFVAAVNGFTHFVKNVLLWSLLPDVGWTLWTSGWSSGPVVVAVAGDRCCESGCCSQLSRVTFEKGRSRAPPFYISARALRDRNHFPSARAIQTTDRQQDRCRPVVAAKIWTGVRGAAARLAADDVATNFFFQHDAFVAPAEVPPVVSCSQLSTEQRQKNLAWDMQASDSVCVCMCAHGRERERVNERVKSNTGGMNLSLPPSIFYLEIGQPPLSTNFLPSFPPPPLF